MAKIDSSVFKEYIDGRDRMTAQEYMRDREVFRQSINDLEDKYEITDDIQQQFLDTTSELNQTKQTITTGLVEFTEGIEQVNQTFQNVQTDIQNVAAETVQAVETEVQSALDSFSSTMSEAQQLANETKEYATDVLAGIGPYTGVAKDKEEMPELKVTQFGVAKDTKEVYVGNGEENMRLLDEKDKMELSSQLTDLVTLKPNGVDDTAAIQNAINRNDKVKLAKGTFICGNLVLPANKSLIGEGVGLTTIKLKDGANTTLLNIRNATDSSVSDITFDGNKAKNAYNENDSVIRIDTTPDYHWLLSNFRLAVERISIKNGASNGLTTFTKKTQPLSYNWIYYLQNITIENCNGYGFWDNTTDNKYQGFLLSYNGIANAYIQAGNNLYMNFKTEGGGKTIEGNISRTSGCNIIMEGCKGVQFINLDCQTAYETGMKIINSNSLSIGAAFDSNGEKWQANPETSQGVGLHITGSKSIVGNMVFYTISTVPNVQATNCYIDSTSKDISLNSEIDEKTVVLGENCIVSSLSKLKNQIDIGTNFIKLFAKNPNKANGFSKALDKGLVPDNLALWLDGSNFTNTPQTTVWVDKSGSGKDGTPYNFAYSPVSGSNGNGGVAFDKTNDYVTIPQIFTDTNNYTVSFTVKFLDLNNSGAYAVLGHGLSANGRVYVGLTSAKKPFVQLFFGNTYDFVIGSTYTANIIDRFNITFTIDRKSKLSIYVNGVLHGYVDISSALEVPYATDTLKINPQSYGTQSNFEMYNLLVYDRVLNEKEISRNTQVLIT